MQAFVLCKLDNHLDMRDRLILVYNYRLSTFCVSVIRVKMFVYARYQMVYDQLATESIFYRLAERV